MIEILSLLAGLAIVGLVWLRHPRSNLPPGPRGIPIFGNLFQMPSDLLFLTTNQLAKTYGPIISYKLMNQTVIILNTAKGAADVLDRLSSKTSDRPRLIKTNEFYTRGGNIGATPKGDRWRIWRRAAHQSLNVRAVKQFDPIMQEEAAFTVQNFLDHPEVKLSIHLQRVAGSTAMRSIFGSPPLPIEGTDLARRIDKVQRDLMPTFLPGSSLVDVLPFLKPFIASIPYLHKQADEWHDEADVVYRALYHDRLEGQESLGESLDQMKDKLSLSEKDRAWIAGVSFMAAQDTTAITLEYFFLAMLLYPQTALPARQQLHEVVGNRPPAFSDRERLPQVDAMVKEVLRWRPSVPLSIAHAASETFEYDGYTIPKGAWIMANLYTIGRDPLVYTDGDAFDPSRFIDVAGDVKKPAANTREDYLAFGHGVRVCLGKDLAIRALWINIASLLWAFDFKKGVDKDGLEITPNEMAFFDGGTTIQPMPFPFQVVPRFSDLAERMGQVSANK